MSTGSQQRRSQQYLLNINLDVLLQVVVVQVQDKVVDKIKPITHDDKGKLVCELGLLCVGKHRTSQAVRASAQGWHCCSKAPQETQDETLLWICRHFKVFAFGDVVFALGNNWGKDNMIWLKKKELCKIWR